MKQETSVAARNYRLQEWAVMVQQCNSRPHGMTVKQWCLEHDVTPANYYYRLTQVRKACLETLSAESIQQQVVPVSQELLGQKELTPASDKSGLDVSVNGFSIHVTDTTNPELLKMVLRVVSNA